MTQPRSVPAAIRIEPTDGYPRMRYDPRPIPDAPEGELIMARFPSVKLRELDRWRASRPNTPSRDEAIVQLALEALEWSGSRSSRG